MTAILIKTQIKTLIFFSEGRKMLNLININKLSTYLQKFKGKTEILKGKLKSFSQELWRDLKMINGRR